MGHTTSFRCDSPRPLGEVGRGRGEEKDRMQEGSSEGLALLNTLKEKFGRDQPEYFWAASLETAFNVKVGQLEEALGSAKR